MPAVTVENPLVLPRVARPDVTTAVARPVDSVVPSTHTVEGAGFEVWRPFPGGAAAEARADARGAGAKSTRHSGLSLSITDPFLLLDQLGPVEYGPGAALGAPWHPHRGFETVTYVLDGEISHHDSTGGGGLIAEGDTQWMTAGGGILHDEVPSERSFREGGPAHGVQLWVNLPSRLKFTSPRYQAITGENLALLSSPDGGALVRLIAGDLVGHPGPGSTHTPITYAHATLSPGAELSVPWNPSYNALAYVLLGQGYAGAEGRPIKDHELVVFGPGDALTLRAADHQDGPSPALEVLLLGGLPIREPIAHYGPFVMNTREEIIQAVDDFNAGRMGTIPAVNLGS